MLPPDQSESKVSVSTRKGQSPLKRDIAKIRASVERGKEAEYKT